MAHFTLKKIAEEKNYGSICVSSISRVEKYLCIYLCINNESLYVLNTVMNTKLQLMSKFSWKYPLQPLGNAKIVTLMVKLACKREKNRSAYLGSEGVRNNTWVVFWHCWFFAPFFVRTFFTRLHVFHIYHNVRIRKCVEHVLNE